MGVFLVEQTVEQTSPISGGIEEVVDGVEEEDEEAKDGKDVIRVDGIPGKWLSLVKVEFGNLHRCSSSKNPEPTRGPLITNFLVHLQAHHNILQLAKSNLCFALKLDRERERERERVDPVEESI